MKKIYLILCLLVFITGCKKSSDEADKLVMGTYTKSLVNSLQGFGEERKEILDRLDISIEQFIKMSTDSAWGLSLAGQDSLKRLRESLEKPTNKFLLQKVISLEEISVYLNNKYGGTIGGFFAYAADVKTLSNMHDVYWGLRLDYPGTKFSEDGTGYGVIRFYTDQTNLIIIPFCPELGGTTDHSWPNGGGGFTTSTLGDGGYPEWKFSGYFEPNDGAELYEMNSNGYEILRGRFTKETKWVMIDQGSAPTKSHYESYTGEKYATYMGRQFILRATIDGICHLATFTDYPELPLQVLEKGIWGINVPEGECESSPISPIS